MFAIAGVTGHVGSVAAEQLLKQGKNVKVLVRSASKGAAWSARGAEVAVGVLDDPRFLANALRGADGFFVLLPPPSFAEKDFYAAQRKMADAIASAVKASGVPYVVLLSAVGADLATGNGPIKGLHYLEHQLRTTGTKLTSIRAGLFQENISIALGAAHQAGIVPNFAPSDEIPTPMIATKDIGAFVAQSLVAPPKASEIVDLDGPEYTMRQVAEKLGAALGKKLQVVNIPPSGMVDALIQVGLPKHFAEVFAEMYAGFGSGALRPKGDRFVQGHTPIDDVIQTLVR